VETAYKLFKKSTHCPVKCFERLPLPFASRESMSGAICMKTLFVSGYPTIFHHFQKCLHNLLKFARSNKKQSKINKQQQKQTTITDKTKKQVILVINRNNSCQNNTYYKVYQLNSFTNYLHIAYSL
jgi:hypothetical protein